MTYTVELRYIGGNLADLLHDMRLWFDRNRTKPEEFHHSSAPPGLAFRVGFGDRDQASAFAEAFQGCVECADPQGTGARWVILLADKRRIARRFWQPGQRRFADRAAGGQPP